MNEISIYVWKHRFNEDHLAVGNSQSNCNYSGLFILAVRSSTIGLSCPISLEFTR